MKTFASALFAIAALLTANARAQAPVVVTARNVKLEKITSAMTTSPEYTVRNTTDKRAEYKEWLEIEVEFSTDGVELIDELTFEYVVEVAGKLSAGEVTHVNIAKGNKHYSVMYVSPRNLERMTGGKKVNAADVGNAWVTISKQSQKLAVKTAKAGPANPPNLPRIPGLLVWKSETPFHPLWWDRYEAVKSGSR